MRKRLMLSAAAAVTGVLLLTAAGVAACSVATRDAASTTQETGAAGTEAGLDASADPSASASASTSASPSVVPATNCGRYAFAKASTSTLRAAKKKAFAFYFPPYPISIENKDPGSDYWAKWTTEADRLASGTKQGEEMLDRPLTRAPLSGNWRQKDFETEIRQAIDMGLDGFIWEYHSVSSDARWTQLPAMLAAAKAVDPGFRIMLSPDLQQGANSTQASIVNDVLKVKSEPALYKVDGKIVLAPFYPERVAVSFWDGIRTTLAGSGVQSVLVPIFLSGSPNVRAAAWNNSVYGYSLWGNRWVGGADSVRKGAVEAHANGRKYMAPIAFEDTRIYDGRYWESSNSGALRAMMEKAIAGDADWLALITWNDYTESWVAPSKGRGYAVADTIAYYTSWFKTGKRPSLVRDALYYFHRSHRTDAPYDTSLQQIAMHIANGDGASNKVELLAFLSAPGKLVIKQGGTVSTKDVTAAGMVSFAVAMVPGTTPSFELQRAGKVVQALQSKVPIKAKVTHQDMMYRAGGGTACGGKA
ncbi:glycoside hydrolase family 71 protein [Hamadaea sp. NPDC051192]|uniref:glycoside hydrolase family 71 protein n=1 Tax=Hamadaea sp. NPDC051192 TaxID=3154940 RepID=UPI00341DA210